MDFNSINDLYLFLENNVAEVSSHWSLTRYFRKLADSLSDEEEKTKIKWESFVWDFELNEGKSLPHHTQNRDDGVVVFEYPSYKDFDEQAYPYLKARAAAARNDFLIVRYNQVLWNSPTKHKHLDQAKCAIDAYMRILPRCSFDDKHAHDGLQVFENGLALALNTAYRREEYKNVVQNWILDNGFDSTSKVLLLEHLLDVPQYKSKDFEPYLGIVDQLSQVHGGEKDLWWLNRINEIGLRIAQRLKADTNIWNERIGDVKVKSAEERKNDNTGMIPLHFYLEAISYYKAGAHTQKVRSTERKYSEHKKKLKLAKVHAPVGVNAAVILNAFFEAETRAVLSRSSEEIFDYLTDGGNIFPKEDWLRQATLNRKNSLFDFVTTLRFDINSNIANPNVTEEDKDRQVLYENYGFFMTLNAFPFLHRLFVEGIKCGKITFPTLIGHFMNRTWLGQTFENIDASGDVMPYRWIDVMAPSLYEYFIQTETALRSSQPYTSYIMPIDSLTLKFEGVLRDFAGLLGVSTTVVGKDNSFREKYIEDLLAEEVVQQYFDQNDRFFFNYLFLRNGLNLRNNVAHCFFRKEHYSFEFMHILICAFLRIGKYRADSQ